MAGSNKPRCGAGLFLLAVPWGRQPELRCSALEIGDGWTDDRALCGCGSRGGATIAGLDLGTKTIGLAVSDLGQRFATPRKVIARKKFTPDAMALIKALDEDRVAGLVLGLPLNMDGSEGPRAQATRAFLRNYEKLDPRPVLLWDERLSTVAAERGLLEADVSPKEASHAHRFGGRRFHPSGAPWTGCRRCGAEQSGWWRHPCGRSTMR